ncbi:MAG: ADP-ribosylglycohydrolase family protein [Acidimicrobiales bacterium]
MTREGSTDDVRTEHAYATLAGLAIGDALGMPTQSLTREQVVSQFEPVLTTFHASRLDHPFAPGLAAGTITDDTEQALILAEELLASSGGFDVLHYARRLIEWEYDVRRRGLSDLLGPSTKQALLNVESGMDPAVAGKSGTTNGAAMRIAPVGIICSSADVETLVDLVIEVSALTHNTPEALSGAAAVAAMIGAGINGGSLGDGIDLALEAARIVESRRAASGAALLSARIERAVDVGRRWGGTALIEAVGSDVGTSLASEESVPAAFAVLVANRDDGWMACRVAASLGGDTDTIGAMTGAMSGALRGLYAFPAWAIEMVERTNHLDLASVARELISARR